MKCQAAISLTLLLCLPCLIGFAQERRAYEVGLNVAPLVQQFVPFAPSVSLIGYSINFVRKSRRKTYDVRLSFGAETETINADFFSFHESAFNLLLGIERTREIGTKFRYRSGYYLFANASAARNQLPHGAGIALSKGLGYDFNSWIGIHTEAVLYLGSAFEDPFIDLRPPFAVFLNIRI